MRRDAVKRLRLFLYVKNLPDGEFAGLASPHRVDFHKLIGIAERKRPDQQSVHEAEDRGVRSDGKTQCDYDGCSESWVLPDLSKAHAQIAEQRVEVHLRQGYGLV